MKTGLTRRSTNLHTSSRTESRKECALRKRSEVHAILLIHLFWPVLNFTHIYSRGLCISGLMTRPASTYSSLGDHPSLSLSNSETNNDNCATWAINVLRIEFEYTGLEMGALKFV